MPGRQHGQRSHDGDYLNIWTCHGPNGEPNPGGIVADTQNFVLEHPERYQPNLTQLHDIGTDRYANVLGDAQGDARPVGQCPTSPAPATNTSTSTPKSPQIFHGNKGQEARAGRAPTPEPGLNFVRLW